MTTPTVFPKFSELPKELQILVWEFALRPDSSGAHFFYVEQRQIPDKFRPHDVGIEPLCRCRQEGAGEGSMVFYWLYTCVGDTPKKNPSMFMVENVVSKVCKLSRVVWKEMLERDMPNYRTTSFFFLPNFPSPLSSASPSFSPTNASLGLEMASSTGQDASTTSDNATSLQRRYFTVYQNDDLFIYRKPKLNWSTSLWWWSVLKDREPPTPLKKLGDFRRHMALE